MEDLRDVTLVFAVKENSIWLAMKKRGFGSDKWNGYGGKVDENETIEQAAIREFEEESGAIITTDDLIKRGEINFYFTQKPEYNQRGHIYVVNTWKGEIHETEEMRPKKFPIDNIPYENMWKGDDLWIPNILAGEFVQGSITFSGDDEQQQVVKADF